MHEVLVNRLGGLSLPSVVRFTDRPDMTLDVKQQCNKMQRLPGPEGDDENQGRRPRFPTSPEGPGKC